MFAVGAFKRFLGQSLVQLLMQLLFVARQHRTQNSINSTFLGSVGQKDLSSIESH